MRLSLGSADRKVRAKKGLDAAFNQMENYLRVQPKASTKVVVVSAGLLKRRLAFCFLHGISPSPRRYQEGIARPAYAGGFKGLCGF